MLPYAPGLVSVLWLSLLSLPVAAVAAAAAAACLQMCQQQRCTRISGIAFLRVMRLLLCLPTACAASLQSISPLYSYCFLLASSFLAFCGALFLSVCALAAG